MILEHNCFPADWIGKRLEKFNDWTYFVDGDSSKQVSIPSGYGKPTSARWLPNGVLRMDSDGGTKFFFVGYQKFFMAYGNETEPHDQYSYQEAVKECKRLRAEEAERNSPKHESHNNDSTTREVNSSKSKSNGIGLGAMIGSAVSAVKDFRSIDDSSSWEEKSRQIMQNMLNEMDERHRKAEEDYQKQKTKNDHIRQLAHQELDKLREIEQKIKAKENKKRIFSDLKKVFEEATFIPDEFLCNYLEIHNPQQKVAISNVVRGYNNSIVQLTFVQLEPSELFFQCWSEIIYLVENGFLFEDKHIETIDQLIRKELGMEVQMTSEDYSSFDDFLKICYSKSRYTYWGYNFEKKPQEDIIKDRIKYLERHSLFLEEDEYYQGYDIVRETINDFEKDNNTIDEKAAVNKKQNEEKKNAATESKLSPAKKDIPRKEPVNDEKYNDLNCGGFKKESSEEDLLKPKNAFDLVTKNKNRKISNKKEKWNDAMWNLDHKLKKNIQRDLLNIEKYVVKLLKLEEELQNLIDSGKSEGILGFGGDKNVKKKKSDIKEIKEKIVEYKEKLEGSIEEFHNCEEDIKDFQEDLYELTGLEKYKSYKPIEGKSIDIAHQLVRSKKNTDSQTLRVLFGL